MMTGGRTTSRQEALRQIDKMLAARQPLAAEYACRDALGAGLRDADILLRQAHARQLMADYEGMLESAGAAVAASPNRIDAQLVAVSAKSHCGQIAEARAMLSTIQSMAAQDPGALKHVSEAWTHLNGFSIAEKCLRTVLELRPNDPAAHYALSSVLLALGNLEGAEPHLNHVLRQPRFDFDAYYNRSTLRRQSTSSNHIAELKTVLGHLPPNSVDEAAVCYALAKECEDIGDHEAAGDFLWRGAAARKRQLSYRVETDVQAMSAIMDTFSSEKLRSVKATSAIGGPVFIVGLPRSGTTLVDRIVSAHSLCASLGELNDLALAVTRLNHPAANKLELIRKSGCMDFEKLGSAYRSAVLGYGERKPWLVDKTPANFLYLGLIALALPEAKIIHLRRHPMAVGHAMLKTLFRMGYPFSYDLHDLGEYITSYTLLMEHWRSTMPVRFLDVDYEELVRDQERVSRHIIDFCGWTWEETCLRFHENQSPSATASAAQVRQPIYSGSVELWRRYEARLEPLERILERKGVLVAPRRKGTNV